jgi:hypothetical protein
MRPHCTQINTGNCLIPPSDAVCCVTRAVFIYFCSLFNDAVSNLDYVASNYLKVLDNKFEGMWKEAAVA